MSQSRSTLDRLDNLLLVVAVIVVVALVLHILAWALGFLYGIAKLALVILAVGLAVRFWGRRHRDH